ncbi:MAG: PEP-CTERM sorting domain-containing protein, partial [Planctomycetota bacterium]|nr:PEP-CTERM sorting domain-containing protein [Planctomycetota bacterium]
VVRGYLLAAEAAVDDNTYPPYPAGIDLERGLAVRGGKVDLGHGTLRIRDWRSGIARGGLRAQRMVIDGPSPWDIVPLDGYVAEDAPAGAKAYGHILRPRPRCRFSQWSGDVALDALTVNGGLYLLRRGTLEADRAEVGGTAFVYGTPTFVQRGGEASFGRFSLGGYFSLYVTHGITNASGDDVPFDTGSLGQVSSSGGRFTAGTIDLRGGIGPATFTQTGGRVEATDYLRIKGSQADYLRTTGGEAAYRMLGGSLTVGTLEVGSRYATDTSDGLATLALMSPVADVHVTERMTLAHGSRLLARRGAAIHLTGTDDDTGTRPGTTFDILSADEHALAGLNALALVFEGGLGGWSTLEVGGVDYGFSNSGFFENFALEELHVGGKADAALLRLVDLVDNQPDWTGDEALYVERLFITEGSWLDPAGLNIYYLEGHFPDVGGRFTCDDEGSRGSLTLLPEPATLALLAAGLGALLRRRRRA